MRCLYLAPSGHLAIVDDPRLSAATERHKIDLTPQPYQTQGHPLPILRGDEALSGIVLEMYLGWPGRDRLRLAREALRSSHRVWLYWPDESAVECLDAERLSSYWRHWLFITACRLWSRVRGTVGALVGNARSFGRVARSRGFGPATTAAVQKLARVTAGDVSTVEDRVQASGRRLEALDALVTGASPVAIPDLDPRPGPERRLPGVGVYLRTDWWAKIESGGSYGHTCYVAKELAAVTGQFVCFMAHRYRLLDESGLRQVVLAPPGATASEDDIVAATEHYHRILKPAFEALRPAYIYERLCLGNYVGALLSQQLGIPYIVEYNGSEISMRRSFDGTGYIYEYEYLKTEMLAFRQATMISVISREVKADLVARGVDPDKILVNPNGADLDAYAPASDDQKHQIRADLGLDRHRPVVGFTGTFGGWHGVDVLAAAIPEICARSPEVQFLLIGDGNYKHLVDTAVSRSGLGDRVRMTGRVPQTEGARLLKACDIYVSPHNSHMVDSKFFGSPTKIFEYMAMGGGIVASDLEQIGECLSPGLTVEDLRDPACAVDAERAVLCTPGDVSGFVEAVVQLAARPDLQAALGRNARQAVVEHYSWARHVAHLWTFMTGERRPEHFTADLHRKARRAPAPAAAADLEGAGPDLAAVAGSGVPHLNGGSELAGTVAVQEPKLATGDRYKDEVQKQWDNDPAGSHYVKEAEPHTLAWFQEVEAYRYAEYAPWMAETMEFAKHAGKELLEIGGGIGTDLSQFAAHGARITDLDLSSGHLELARENFERRGLEGRFIHHDAETLPFDAGTFDVVYSNGVIHHTPNTRGVVREMWRVLKPGGVAIIMVYAENSLHYWRNLVLAIGLEQHELQKWSMGEIMSRAVERSDNAAARPLVKVYTPRRLRQLFDGFDSISIVQRQMVDAEKPRLLRWVPLPLLGQMMGWNLIIKARKPLN